MAAPAGIAQRAQIADVIANKRGGIRMQVGDQDAAEHGFADGNATGLVGLDNDIAVGDMITRRMNFALPADQAGLLA